MLVILQCDRLEETNVRLVVPDALDKRFAEDERVACAVEDGERGEGGGEPGLGLGRVENAVVPCEKRVSEIAGWREERSTAEVGHVVYGEQGSQHRLKKGKEERTHNKGALKTSPQRPCGRTWGSGD